MSSRFRGNGAKLINYFQSPKHRNAIPGIFLKKLSYKKSLGTVVDNKTVYTCYFYGGAHSADTYEDAAKPLLSYSRSADYDPSGKNEDIYEIPLCNADPIGGVRKESRRNRGISPIKPVV